MSYKLAAANPAKTNDTANNIAPVRFNLVRVDCFKKYEFSIGSANGTCIAISATPAKNSDNEPKNITSLFRTLTLNDKEYITPINPSAISILYHLSSIKLFKKVSIKKPFELNFSSKSIIAQKGFFMDISKKGEQMNEDQKIDYEAQAKRFDKAFRKISKKLREFERDDQTKMIKLIVARFNYAERLRYDELKLSSIFGQR